MTEKIDFTALYSSLIEAAKTLCIIEEIQKSGNNIYTSDFTRTNISDVVFIVNKTIDTLNSFKTDIYDLPALLERYSSESNKRSVEYENRRKVISSILDKLKEEKS